MDGKIGALLCAFAAMVSLATAQSTTNIGYINCGSTAEIISLNVDPCPPYKDGCQLVRPSTVTFRLQFRPANDIPQLTHAVYGYVFGMKMPFNGLGGSNACPKVEGGCPIQAGANQLYTSEFNILRGFPPLSVDIQYEISSGTEQVVCFRMKSKLQ